MAKKPPKSPDRLKKVLQIALGEQAQERKVHNNRPMPGDMRSATAVPDEDRLSRALAKSEAADVAIRRQAKEGRPGEGEIFEATSGPTQEERDRIAVEKFLHLAKERFKLAAEASSLTNRMSLQLAPAPSMNRSRAGILVMNVPMNSQPKTCPLLRTSISAS